MLSLLALVPCITVLLPGNIDPSLSAAATCGIPSPSVPAQAMRLAGGTGGSTRQCDAASDL